MVNFPKYIFFSYKISKLFFFPMYVFDLEEIF